MTEGRLLVKDLKNLGRIGSVMAMIATTSGPYNVIFEIMLRAGNPHSEKYETNVEVLDAPGKEITLHEGEDRTIRVIAAIGNMAIMPQAAITKRNLTLVDKKFYTQGDSLKMFHFLQCDDEVTDESVEGLSFDYAWRDENTTVEIVLRFEEFNAQRHSGYYCLLLTNRYMDVTAVGACTLFKGSGEVLPKGVIIETCSGDLYSPLKDKMGLVVNSTDCLRCSAVGYSNPQMHIFKRGSNGQDVMLDTKRVSMGTNWIRQSVYRLPNVSRSDDGVYTCVVFDDDDITRAATQIRAIEDRLRVTKESVVSTSPYPGAVGS
jgi:hypothetical protein